MMITPAKRLEKITPQFFSSLNEKVAALRKTGYDVIRLDIGSPDLPPPAHILAALSDSAGKENHHGYQAHSATPALRQAWAETYQRLYEVELDPTNEVVPLLGSKEDFPSNAAMIDLGISSISPIRAI
jgi:aspartate/methionine/tyrosine aminotransferase